MAEKKTAKVKPNPRKKDDRAFLQEIIGRVVDECPRRQAATACERRAQEMFQATFEERGVSTEMLPFRYNDNLYANLALHAGVGLAGSALFGAAPWASFALHTLTGVSYIGDSTKQFFILRRLQKFKPSQNLVATQPAEGEPALRIVLVGHADAALTGLIFDSRLTEKLVGEDHEGNHGILSRPLLLATASQFALAGVDLLGMAMGPARRLLWPAVGALSIPAVLTAAATMDVVLRDHVVPGANDNLTGCAALPLLAERLGPGKPADVELVFVVAGAEEAGLGGSWALANQMRERWDPRRTVMLGLDGLTNGNLVYFDESEIIRYPLAPWLVDVVEETAAADPRFAAMARHEVGVGHTDSYPFRGLGYDAVTIGCIDPKLGTPRHYHQPGDSPENLEWDMLETSIDYTEQLVLSIIRNRLG